ncbi:tetratricopeptide repeat protein [Leucothrix arctica]|uniref:Sel1 repeat family protein n=1 Tax=Leucothrix arctica TaxID=1481894 RepID=A0A317CPG8_9GAMM|nr:tetratricopeptide repeat protein [Leucothrix arctica]PWQ99363.1 sel1 repeat family protein [Leucothrix arctica]
MGKFLCKVVTAAVFSLLVSQAAFADVEKGRQLMEQSKFTEAMQEFLPAAQAGNADAEELIGVMYAMGLGVKKDDRRAFEWYLRASMKAHPGAQSGIGWYYEVGRGVEVDLVRAYMWYVLSAIGGDPDAAISQEEVIKKMTPGQVKEAQILIADYKPHLYPFD